LVFDVIVVGLGVMGSGVVYQLARRGFRVLGIDQFHPPHTYGSSHGYGRAIRLAYEQDSRYVQYVRRAYEAWQELECSTGSRLMINTGLLIMGEPEAPIIQGGRQSADMYGIAYDLLDRRAIRDRWPALHMDDEMCGFYEPTGAVLRVEPCIETLLKAAKTGGALLRLNEPVRSWSVVGKEVHVRTNQGDYVAARLVISAGAWCKELLPKLQLPLKVERQVQLWFQPDSDSADWLSPQCFPYAAWQYDEDGHFYAFPDFGHGVKVAHHRGGQMTSPQTIQRDVDDQDVQSIRTLLKRYLPSVNGPLKSHAVCMYTNTPDLNFLIDEHPDFPEVLIVGGFSGHGFKFAPAIGESVADLLSGQQPDTALEMFKIQRLQDKKMRHDV